MKEFLKFIFAIFLAGNFAACSDNNNNNQKPPVEEPVVIMLTKLSISYVNGEDTSTTTANILYNTQKQITGTNSIQIYRNSDSGYSSQYTSESKLYYTGGKITSTSSTANSSNSFGEHNTYKDSSIVETDAQGRVVKAIFFNDEDHFTTATGINEYTWTGNKVTEAKEVLSGKAYTISYVNGNIVLLESTDSSSTMRFTATFDTKKNPYSLLLNFQLAFFEELPLFIGIPEDDEILSVFNTNNITQCSFQYQERNDVFNHTYEYNEEGYVTKAVQTNTRNGGISTTVYTYEKR